MGGSRVGKVRWVGVGWDVVWVCGAGVGGVVRIEVVCGGVRR